MTRANRVQIIKYAPPPPELPVFGKVDPEEVSFIGRTNYVAALEEKEHRMVTVDLCPKCGEGTLVFEESCKKCYNCGYSEC